MITEKSRSIKTMAELESRLRRTNQKQAALYLFCNFISLMLMTVYSGLMFSPTVQDIFPPGRRQPETVIRHLRSGPVRLRYIYDLCCQPFSAKITAAWHPYGSQGFQKNTGARSFP